MEFITDYEGIKATAKEIHNLIKDKSIVAFYGSMGAGKTTLIKAICDVMGVENTVTSPTFSIVNEYYTKDKQIVYHFDFYRIENISEAYDFGYEEYFDSGNLCLIEWPEKIEELLPLESISINIEILDDGKRVFRIGTKWKST